MESVTLRPVGLMPQEDARMAGRVGKAEKAKLIEAGQWEAFLRRRDELKAEGFDPRYARASALAEALASACGSGTPQGEDARPEALPLSPPELEGKSGSEPEIIRWVARHVDHPSPSPADCPDPFAWTLLRECRGSRAFLVAFIEKQWAKLIPSRAQLDSDQGVDFDGKVTINMIDKILAMKERAESGKLCGEAVQATP